MVQPANSSASLAMSHTPRKAQARWAAPDYNNARALPRTVNGSRTISAPGALPRPAMPAEIAQARVFESLLQAESAELCELAHRISGTPDRQPPDSRSASPGDLLQIRARLAEVQDLLQALQGRFPHQLADPNL